MYANGRDVPQDYAKAIEWYRLAAEQGHADAQFHLGTMYYRGRGVRPEFVQAHMWLSLAVASEKEIASLAAETRENLMKSMTSDEIDKAQRLARGWMERQQNK